MLSAPIWTAEMAVVNTRTITEEAKMVGEGALRVIFGAECVRNIARSVLNGDTLSAIDDRFARNIPNSSSNGN